LLRQKLFEAVHVRVVKLRFDPWIRQKIGCGNLGDLLDAVSTAQIGEERIVSGSRGCMEENQTRERRRKPQTVQERSRYHLKSRLQRYVHTLLIVMNHDIAEIGVGQRQR